MNLELILGIVALALSIGAVAGLVLYMGAHIRAERKNKDIKTVEILMKYNEYVTDNAQEISDALYYLAEGADEEIRDGRQFLEKTEGIAVLYNRGSISKKTVNRFIGGFLRTTYEEPLKAVISKIQKDDPRAYIETRNMCESMLAYQT